jgi:serine/threonine-protein kinase
MALRKEPERRYQSVEHFSEDIRRHLEGLPVTARKDTIAYRTAKFVRRNKIAVSAAAITFFALIAFIIGLVIQSDKIARQRDQAENERDKSDKISAFLVNLFRSSDPYESKGNSITAREILDRGANKIANDLNNQPEVQAAVMDTIGEVYVNLGLFESAEPLLKQALAVRKQTLPANHPDIVDSLNHVGSLYYGQNKHEAEATFREAISTARKLPSDKQLKLAESLSGLGKTLSVAGKLEDAKTAFQEALSIQRKFLAKDHIDIASNLIYLAQISGGKEPEGMYQEALSIFKKHNHPKQANCLMSLAGINASKGNYDQAIKENEEACAIRKKVFGDESLSLAICLHNLGSCYYQKGDDKSAEIVFSDVLAIREKHLDSDNPEIGFDLFFLASALHGQGKLRDAEILYRRSLAIQKKNLPPDHPEVARSNAGLGRVLVDAGHAEEAQTYLVNAQQIYKKTGLNRPLSEVESILGSCMTELGNYKEAEQLMLKSYQSLVDLGLSSARETRETRAHLYHLYEVWEKPEKMNQFKD